MHHWSEYDDDQLTDLLVDTNLSVKEISLELDRELDDVTKRIRDLGLSWIRRKKGYVSRGQGALMDIMKELLPGETIVSEEPIGKRLRLDVYCPTYQIAAEYHGRQHFQYIPFFHTDKDGFEASQRRDEEKVQLCKDLGIALVVFRYCDTLTKDAVFNRLLDAIRSTPFLEEKKPSMYKGNAYYEAAKKRQREYKRQQYRKMKKAQRGRG